jgi:hypothetical protein
MEHLLHGQLMSSLSPYRNKPVRTAIKHTWRDMRCSIPREPRQHRQRHAPKHSSSSGMYNRRPHGGRHWVHVLMLLRHIRLIQIGLTVGLGTARDLILVLEVVFLEGLAAAIERNKAVL